MSCRHVVEVALPRPFKGTEVRCRLTDERENPSGFLATREALARTGLSAGLTRPYAADGRFRSCPMWAAPSDQAGPSGRR